MTQLPGCIPHRPHAEVAPRALKMYATILRRCKHTTPIIAPGHSFLPRRRRERGAGKINPGDDFVC